MRIPYQIKCLGCNSDEPVYIPLEDISPEWICEKCKKHNLFQLDSEITIGNRLLFRAQFELDKNRDRSMCVVLAAMAFEGELARAYRLGMKWKIIRAGDDPGLKDFEDSYMELYGYRNKLKEVCKLLKQQDFDHFASKSERYLTAIKEHSWLTVGKFVDDIGKFVLVPRNRIIHQAKSELSDGVATKTWSTALLTIDLIKEMRKLFLQDSKATIPDPTQQRGTAVDQARDK